MLVLLLGALALPPLAPLWAQAGAPSRIRAETLARDLEYLSSDALRGRNTFSPGFDSAALYIARRLREAGLKPLGDGGGFYQYYSVLEEEVDTAGAYLEIEGRRFPFGTGFVLLSFAGELGGDLPAAYVGHGWIVRDRGIDPYEGVGLHGKLAVVEGPLAPPAGLGIQRIGRVFPGAVSPLWAARERGAVGLLVLPDSASLGNWDRLANSNLTRFELDPPVPSAYAAAPLGALLLSREAASALMAGEAPRGGVPFELVKKVRVKIPLSAKRVHRGYNVVAMLEGSDPVLRAEYVTVESHLDGAVGRTPLDGDSIYNAADDNASGSAVTLAIAEEMAAAGPSRRSVIFIWDSGEERGLWGTRWFVHRPPVPLDRIVAHFNVDMVGASRAPGSPDSATPTVTGPDEVYLIGPGVLSRRLDSLVVAVNRSHLDLKLNRAYDRQESEFFYPRTDAGPFLERGIPTVGFFTGLHDRYHRPSDEARYLDPHKMERIARTVLAIVRAVADWDERPRIEQLPPTVPRYR
ncbi:MAG: aminopeptidase [Gemmatimonadales bacterium]|nr:MAG: aminopeptidase [Gemmatimonadales bacterium]